MSTAYVSAVVPTDDEIGSLAGVASGSRVDVPVARLDHRTRYSWYATVTDPDGATATSPVWDFTTIGWEGRGQRQRR